ncbi:hypothetical protein BOTBODRAFT_38220 [Botryobasidium botryosum FD-172 SS1]|uniref:Uncharacterized protein n=1 Tax=Botryobasidium botryosum (strain FD-172 SS1) TaxID=930990 RepID=A0A067LY05_BOTB1|nr:hypothetical protein BOTBODRAFT_38220 [Botryobasidium botryosum FD-172 SS1]
MAAPLNWGQSKASRWSIFCDNSQCPLAVLVLSAASTSTGGYQRAPLRPYPIKHQSSTYNSWITIDEHVRYLFYAF